MKLTVVAGHCAGGSCPTLFTTSDHPEDLVIQGYVVDDPSPDGEAKVRIPRSLLNALDGHQVQNREQ